MKTILLIVISIILLGMLICEYIGLTSILVLMIYCCFAMTSVIMIMVMFLLLAEERSVKLIKTMPSPAL